MSKIILRKTEKSPLEHHNNSCCGHPLRNATISGKKTEEQTGYLHSLSLSLPKYLLITVMVIMYIHKFFVTPPSRKWSLTLPFGCGLHLVIASNKQKMEKKTSKLEQRNLADTISTKWSKSASPGISHEDVMYPLIGRDEKDPSPLWYSPKSKASV